MPRLAPRMGICNGEAHENQLEDKSIAIQKGAAIVSDQNAPGTSPGDVIAIHTQLFRFLIILLLTT